mgnify:CR=1 FL=1
MRILKNVICSILVMFMFLYGINAKVKANSDEIAKLNINETYSNIDLTAVTNFNTLIMGANLVKLSWNTVKGADGYIIYRKIADGKFEYRYMVSNTTYTDTTAQTGEYNFYRVYPYKNVNGKRVLGPSNEYKYAKPMPLAVTNLKTIRQNSNIKITWNTVSNADGYIIYRQSPNDSKMIYRYMVNSTSFVDTQTMAPGYYYYRVYAYKNVNGKRVLGPSNNYSYVKIPKTINKYTEGMYRAGRDVPEGEYIVFKNNANLGYYEVTLTGNNDDIITNDILEYNGYITLQKGQSISLQGLDMYPVNHAPDLDMSSAGMFKVGKDIPAGTYKVVVNPEKEYGYYAICNDSYNRWDSIESNDYFKGNRFVTVKDGQYLQIKDSKIERIN